ncbi:MAG: hypothetical protein ACTSYI_09440, partial [Promethearchaeota archaeon]
LKGLDPAVLAIAAFDQLQGLSNDYVRGIEYIIPLTFTVILFITLIQSFILSAIIFKKNDKALYLPSDSEPIPAPTEVLVAFE